jgi:head-tail adaptor
MLNRTMTVTRPTYSTTSGRTDVSFSAHLSGVPCRAHQLSGSEAVRSGAERGVNLWRFSVPATYDIKRTDRVTFADPDGVSHVIDVQSVRNSSHGFDSTSIIKVIEGEEVT